MSKKDFSVGVVAVRKTSNGFEYLLVKHALGHWGFPKGHIEEGESREDAVRRELKEEAGITDIEIIPGKEFSQHYSFEHEGYVYDKEVVYYVGLVKNPEIKIEFTDEILDAGWFLYKEAVETIGYDNAKELIKEVEEYLRNENR